MKVLITGGAGFVGSNLAVKLKTAHPDYRIISFDNLKRRGSELSLERLKGAEVEFIHGDIRNPEDLEQIENIDIILECSAEPSAQAGYGGGSKYLVNTNLAGTVNCLELARKCRAAMIFLSTSRVYPIAAMRSLPLERIGDRLDIPKTKSGIGWSAKGIDTGFPMEGSRSLYGATKLCSEILIQEYAAMYDLPAVINRCGVITGPWQMAKVDQGFVTLWAARHLFGGSLQYIGFGGNGLQVRDILHIDDLFDLIDLQLSRIQDYRGNVFNVGGGREISVSLLELTQICSKICGNSINIDVQPETHPADIPYYVTNNSDISSETGWKPKRSVAKILDDIFLWLRENKEQLRNIIG
jgi:CDP-paratose 2-epimerase